MLRDGTGDGDNSSIRIQKLPEVDEERAVGLKEVVVDSIDQFSNALKSAYEKRKVAATGRNANSSRSHGVIQVILKSEKFESHLMMLDLAGAENATDHVDVDAIRKTEMAKINKVS